MAFALPSSLHSVLNCPHQGWDRVPSYEPLARFHEKYWGKSMEPEETEWRNIQLKIGQGDRSEENKQGEDISMEDNVKDEDILPGCYYLDINIQGLPCKGLWIRPDYVRIYDALHHDYPLPMVRMGLTPCVVLTGQPGIGKSVWIWYAAHRRMAAREPFLLYHRLKLHLFVNEGVYDVPDTWDYADFRHFIWTFIDSDEASDGIPLLFVRSGAPLFIIFATSPAAGRWKRFHKTMLGPQIIIMNPWSKSEILQILPHADTVSRIFNVFDRLGPIPCLCLLPKGLLSEYEHDLDQVILRVDLSVLERAFMDGMALQMDDTSRRICLVTRKDRDDVYSDTVMRPITDWVKSRLALQLRHIEKALQLRLMRQLSRVPESRALIRVLYEARAQSDLLGGVDLNLIRMVKKPGSSPPGQPQPQWHSSHILFHDDVLNRLREKEPHIPLTIKPESWQEYSDDGLSSIKTDVMYIPASSNQKAFDSFILVDGILYLFQFTIASTHHINRGLIEVGEKSRFPDMAQWRFTFVIPPNTTLKVPQVQREPLNKLELYSAILDVGVEIPVE